MNVEITFKEKYFIVESIDTRIRHIDSLIESFSDEKLIQMYVKEQIELIQLKDKLQSL